MEGQSLAVDRPSGMDGVSTIRDVRDAVKGVWVLGDQN
jgi:hypothetical protein